MAHSSNGRGGFSLKKTVQSVFGGIGSVPGRTARTRNPHPPTPDSRTGSVRARTSRSSAAPSSSPTPTSRPSRGGAPSSSPTPVPRQDRPGYASSAPKTTPAPRSAGAARFMNQLDKAVVSSRGKRDKRFR